MKKGVQNVKRKYVAKCEAEVKDEWYFKFLLNINKKV